MSIKVRIDPILLPLTGNESVVEVEGENVRQCLDYLQARFPGLRAHLLDSQGKLWSDVGIFLNNDTAYPSQPVEDGDELFIMLPIGGG